MSTGWQGQDGLNVLLAGAERPHREAVRRRVIGALLGVALLVIAAQVLPRQVSLYVMALTVAAPVVSFGRDVTLLLRQRADALSDRRGAAARARR